MAFSKEEQKEVRGWKEKKEVAVNRGRGKVSKFSDVGRTIVKFNETSRAKQKELKRKGIRKSLLLGGRNWKRREKA